MIFVKVKILLFLILIGISIQPVFAQSEDIPFLSVKTDDNHYDEGDTVVISGQLKTVIVDTPIIVQLWYEGNLIDAAQFFPAQDGSYSHTIIAEKPLWRSEGEYLIRVSHGEGNIAETTIEFTPKQEFLETTDSFEVQIPNGGTFDVEFTIKGGAVVDMILEPDNYTLIVLVETPDEGTISLKLPRASIDAEKSNGQDETFIVLIDNVQYLYQETEKTSQTRLITINFEEGDSKIEIIGTRVVPEFGAVTILIFIIGIIAMVGITKTKFQMKL